MPFPFFAARHHLLANETKKAGIANAWRFMLEGLLYTFGAALAALVLILLTAPWVGPALNGLIWFFTYRFTLWPVALILPIFAVLGVVIPVLSGRAAERYSVVERLRQE